MPPGIGYDNGPRTTASSSAEGRLKVGVMSKKAKRKVAEKVVKKATKKTG